MRHAKTLLTAAVLTGGAAVPASADIVSFGFSIGLSDACAPTYYDTSYDCGVYTYSYSGYGWPGYGYSGYRPWWSAYRPAWYSTWCAPAYVYRPVCPPPVIVVPRPVYYYGYSPSWCWPSYGSWCDDGVTWGFGYSSWSGWSISFGWSSGWSSWHRPRPWHCGDGYWRDGRDWDHRPGRGGWDGRAGASAPLVGPTSDLAKPLASNMPAAGALGVAGVGSTDKPRLLPAVGS
ncbi:MAG: hypothetical protein KIT68_13405, partial [Phycisphaeraceae bacterium]|nr:hypothetical protein [Phycisphaeraceae bacterium]